MINRRGFLKNSLGLSVGTVYSGTLLSLLTGVAEANDGTQVTVHERGLMVSNPIICVSCRRCEIACTRYHETSINPMLSRVKVLRNMNYGPHGVQENYEIQRGEAGDGTIVVDTCRHCSICTSACPYKAISVNKKTGARVVDENLCVGCGKCAERCPWKMISVNKITNKAFKCDLCDGDPSCAKACPTGSIKYYTWSEAEAILKKHTLYSKVVASEEKTL